MVKSVGVKCLSDDCERDETIRDVGRCLPSPTRPTPPFYQVHRFAPKNKKSSEEIVHCGQVYEKSLPKMKNFDIRLPCDSHSETHRMNKECQDLTTAGDAIPVMANLLETECPKTGPTPGPTLICPPLHPAHRATHHRFPGSLTAPWRPCPPPAPHSNICT
ncbi:RPL18A: 60S ribosomal protein L18a [Crotalus adamanteus]|uniref:RPL18A: 60S ribosomal protein L18a n=1 Tax=Crotalus adamanteus TaxID=8729 RepID=A0AAW1BRX6_CROAD